MSAEERTDRFRQIIKNRFKSRAKLLFWYMYVYNSIGIVKFMTKNCDL